MTRQAAEETRKELEPIKKTLTDIAAQCVDAKLQSSKNDDTTFGICRRQDGQLAMGNKVVQVVNGNKGNLTVDGTEYISSHQV